MVSTENCYTTDNFPTLKMAILRGEYLYQVRLYEERPSFQSAKTGNMRMRMLLGFIEAKVIVVDAIMKTEGTLQYLSVLCSSPASACIFSQIMNSISKKIIIEELERSRAEEFLSSSVIKNISPSFIPFSQAIQSVNESKKILFTLLLEYRALLSEFTSNSIEESKKTKRSFQDFNIPFIIFEHDTNICAIPEYQIESLTRSEDGSFLITCQQQWNSCEIKSDDILCIKELDITQCSVNKKRKPGFYKAVSPVSGGDFYYTLVVPSFLK